MLPDSHLSKCIGFVWVFFPLPDEMCKSLKQLLRLQQESKQFFNGTHSLLYRGGKTFVASEKFYSGKTAKKKATESSVFCKARHVKT